MSGQAWFVRVNEFFLRNKFPRFFTDFVYAVITPKSHKEDLEARTAHIAEISMRHESVVNRIVFDNERLAVWMSSRKLKLLPGKQFALGAAFESMENLYGQSFIVAFFDQFVVTDSVFVGTVDYFSTIWTFFRENGYCDETGAFTADLNEEETQLAMSQLLNKKTTAMLIAVGPKEWTYDDIYQKVVALP
jgi:hypothetical protein